MVDFRFRFELNHGFGLWKNQNKTDYLTKKINRFSFVPKKVTNYLGVNGTNNDMAWDCIKSYSDSVPIDSVNKSLCRNTGSLQQDK